MNIMDCIQKLQPGWRGIVIDNDYNKIKPNELETRPTPSLAELEGVWPIIEAERVAAEQADVNRIAAKAQAILDNLPSWAVVSGAVDNIGNLADAKAFLKKLARVVYWLAKDIED